jgi:hypothetical protein
MSLMWPFTRLAYNRTINDVESTSTQREGKVVPVPKYYATKV